MRTQYDENERALNDVHLSNFGINPPATRMVVDSYIRNISPKPLVIDYEMLTKAVVGDKHLTAFIVEITIRKPGYIGKSRPQAMSVEGLDLLAFKLFIKSYVDNVRPRPFSFVYKGIEIHLRTKGHKEEKNIARYIFNQNT